MIKKILILIILSSIYIGLKSQESKFDQIIFIKNNIKIDCYVLLEGGAPTDFLNISYEDTNGIEDLAPLEWISKIIMNGKVVYDYRDPGFMPPGPPEDTSVFDTTIVDPCIAKTEKLKLEITEYALNRYNELKNKNISKNSRYEPASYAMEKKVEEIIYTKIIPEIEKLNKQTTSLDAVITIYVNQYGKMVKIEEEIKQSVALRNFTKLKESTIYPFLETITYPITKSTTNKKINIYNDLLTIFQVRIDSSGCQEHFDEILKLEKERFNSLNQIENIYNTVYQIPIKYNFISKYQKWTYYKNSLKIKNKKSFVTVTNSQVKKDFLSKVKFKQKNAKYLVNANYYSIIDDSLKITVNSVKRKYKYNTHFGITSQVLAPLNTRQFNNIDFKMSEFFTVNGTIIFHRIGFFFGTLLQNKTLTDKSEGLYITNNPRYIETGLYVGIAPPFYFKAGYTNLNAQLSEYKNNIYLRSSTYTSHGFTTGLALIFPYVNFEFGYNYTFNSLYGGLGFNIYLNK